MACGYTSWDTRSSCLFVTLQQAQRSLAGQSSLQSTGLWKENGKMGLLSPECLFFTKFCVSVV